MTVPLTFAQRKALRIAKLGPAGARLRQIAQDLQDVGAHPDPQYAYGAAVKLRPDLEEAFKRELSEAPAVEKETTMDAGDTLVAKAEQARAKGEYPDVGTAWRPL